MKIKQLDGMWNLSPDSVSTTLPYSRYFQKNPSILMTMPGDVHTALLESEIISDPYWGTDDTHMQWVGSCDWRAEREFTVDKDDLTGRKAILTMSMVDTYVDVLVNGKQVGSCSNQFRRWRFDCSNVLVPGTNTIELLFSSPEQAAGEEMERLPHPTSPDNPYQRNLIRKSHSHSGTISTPRLLAMGIYEPMMLEFVEMGYIDSTNTVTTPTETGWHVHVDIAFHAVKRGSIPMKAQVADREVERTVRVIPGDNCLELDMEVKEVEPWMPLGYGKPFIYPLTITVGTQVIERKIGFRTVRLSTDDCGAFILTVNDHPIFAKGTVWVPMDAIPSKINASRYRQLLQDAVEANMNMIRVSGKGMYEHDLFYQICDEKGLLVWQDCMFSGALYPSSEQFLDNVEKELEYQVGRLGEHPSIVLWCGNDEGLQAFGRYGESQAQRDRYVIAYDRLNEGVVGNTIRRLDPTRPWCPSPPSAGSYGSSSHPDGSVDLHHAPIPGFVSESGQPSIPSLATIASFASKDQWNISSKVMEHHQRHPSGNGAILEQLIRNFRLPSGFASMVYLSQVQQALAMKTAIEYFRSQRPACMGILCGQLNDTWPVVSPSSIEYGGTWKLAHYGAKRYYAPLLPILYVKDDQIELYVVNETSKDLDLRLSMKFRRFDGTKVSEQVYQPHVKSDTSCKVASFPLEKLPFRAEDGYIHVKLSNKDLLIENSLFTAPLKHCSLINPGLSCTIDDTHDGFLVSVSCKAPAFHVALDAGSIEGTFSDNLFDVRPTANKSVRFKPRKPVTRETFLQHLRIYDVYGSSHEPII